MTHILKRLAAAACMTLTLGIAFAGQPLKIESITYEPQANVNDGIKANLQPAKEKAISAGLEALRSLMRSIGDVKTGDIIDFDYSPDKGTTVHLNDKPVGEPIGGGRALYNAVLAIWLGDNAIDDGLKKKLLKSGD